MTASTVLWIYIVLLVIGGLIGFIKAKSNVSLYLSIGFAVALTLCAIGLLPMPVSANWLQGALLIVFAVRLAKTKKFMPAGLMLVVTVLALALQNLLPAASP